MDNESERLINMSFQIVNIKELGHVLDWIRVSWSYQILIHDRIAV